MSFVCVLVSSITQVNKKIWFIFFDFFLGPFGKQVHENTRKNSEDVPVEGEEDKIYVESLLDVTFE